MQTITTIGFDIAKSVFQVHYVDACRPGDHPPSVEAPLCPRVFPEAAAVPDRLRSLRLITLLVAGVPGARAYAALDACGLLPFTLGRRSL